MLIAFLEDLTPSPIPQCPSLIPQCLKVLVAQSPMKSKNWAGPVKFGPVQVILKVK